jgi:hypothetical protein
MFVLPSHLAVVGVLAERHNVLSCGAVTTKVAAAAQPNLIGDEALAC